MSNLICLFFKKNFPRSIPTFLFYRQLNEYLLLLEHGRLKHLDSSVLETGTSRPKRLLV